MDRRTESFILAFVGKNTGTGRPLYMYCFFTHIDQRIPGDENYASESSLENLSSQHANEVVAIWAPVYLNQDDCNGSGCRNRGAFAFSQLRDSS
jgi:hypothetical protein